MLSNAQGAVLAERDYSLCVSVGLFANRNDRRNLVLSEESNQKNGWQDRLWSYWAHCTLVHV